MRLRVTQVAPASFQLASAHAEHGSFLLGWVLSIRRLLLGGRTIYFCFERIPGIGRVCSSYFQVHVDLNAWVEDARRTHGAGKGCTHGGLAAETYGMTDLASQLQST